ncbi:MAG TPA: hemerythrin domain-containing protein [Acidimicrobiales bacterium]|jgi:iron-sulfur cluster repair protein YtfE (RIC family)|nr:hemerythrin domain-containing protein [Acidimicrobiales bacterium]
MDVLDHLIEEHRKVERLIGQIKETEPGDERDRLYGEIEDALAVHMAVEERFLYPLIAEHIGKEDSEDATDEHTLTRTALASVKERLEEGAFEAAVDVLEKGIDHHVSEEEEELFPELRAKAASQLATLDPEQLEEQVKPVAEVGDLTKDELYEQAKEADVPGRSSMTKDELAEALDK